MDERLQRIERSGSPAEKLRARRRAGWGEAEAWGGLVTPELPYADALELAKQLGGLRFLEVTRQTCGDLEGETGRFEHEATGLRLRLIPGGSYLMGSVEAGPKKLAQHHVSVAPFLLCETPCPLGAWDLCARQAQVRDDRRWTGEALPIEMVSWNDARAWCEAVGLRLPSEAEWEYACRARSTGSYCFGESHEDLWDYAWFSKNSGSRTQPVGRKTPNAWGLHDMHGNVSEWCEDDWADDDWTEAEEGAPSVGWPARKIADGPWRVLRGSTCHHSAFHSGSDFRHRFTPSRRNSLLSFRPARSLR